MKRHITHLLGTGIAILALSLTACDRHPQAKAFYLKAEEAFDALTPYGGIVRINLDKE